MTSTFECSKKWGDYLGYGGNLVRLNFTAKSLFLPSSPTLLPQGEKGAMPLPSSDYASLIEPTWLPPRLFDPSKQGAAWLLLPLPRGRLGGGHGPIRQPAWQTPALPLEKGRGQSRGFTGCVAEWYHSNCSPAFRGAEPPKKRGPGCPPGPTSDGRVRCWI